MTDLTIKEITKLEYQRPDIDKGYANQYLNVDISASTISIEPITQQMKDVFVGGKGFDLWLLWNAVSASRWLRSGSKGKQTRDKSS